MRPHHSTALALLLLVPGCAASTPPPPAAAQVPDSLLTCPSAPTKPATFADDRDLWSFVATGFAAGAECRAQLARVRTLLAPAP